MFQHLQHCEKYSKTVTFSQLPDIDTNASHVNLQAHITSFSFSQLVDSEL